MPRVRSLGTRQSAQACEGELLPTAWPRAQARELFIACYDLLGPLAARRVRQIITRYSPELAGRAAYHSSELKLSAAPDPAATDG